MTEHSFGCLSDQEAMGLHDLSKAQVYQKPKEMTFEKEAEEIAKDIYIHHFDDNVNYPEVLKAITVGVQKGAEFGYNKAKEWHYVKDGDLPPLNTNVLVIHRWARTPEVGKRIEVFIDSSVWVWAMCSDRYRYTSDDENVIAWKEIVLPELKESE